MRVVGNMTVGHHESSVCNQMVECRVPSMCNMGARCHVDSVGVKMRIGSKCL